MDLTSARLSRLSDICSDVAQLSVASIVIPFLVDKSNVAMIILGLITALIFWILSYYLAR